MNRICLAIFIAALALGATGKAVIGAEQAQQAAEINLSMASAGYADVPRGHWAFEAVQRTAQHGLMEGHPDGLFRGDQPLTRYEFPVALARMLNTGCAPAGHHAQFRWKSLDELEKDRLFPPARSADVPRGHYAYEAVQIVQRLGIMQGNTNNEFSGDKPLTRYEYVNALTRLLQLKRRVPK